MTVPIKVRGETKRVPISDWAHKSLIARRGGEKPVKSFFKELAAPSCTTMEELGERYGIKKAMAARHYERYIAPVLGVNARERRTQCTISRLKASVQSQYSPEILLAWRRARRMGFTVEPYIKGGEGPKKAVLKALIVNGRVCKILCGRIVNNSYYRLTLSRKEYIAERQVLIWVTGADDIFILGNDDIKRLIGKAKRRSLYIRATPIDPKYKDRFAPQPLQQFKDNWDVLR